MTGSETYPYTPASIHLDHLRRNWGWITGLGVLFVVGGLLALYNVVAATLVTVLYVGVAMLVAGVTELVTAFQMRPWSRSLFWAALGAVTIFAGFLVFRDPLLAAVSLTALLGAAFIVAGVFKLVIAFHIRELGPWAIVALSGAISLLLGVMILVQWPESSVFILGLFLAVNLLFEGIGWIVVGMTAKPESIPTSADGARRP